ncbi:MAG: hypothetical protein IE909_09480 [Campylobacterales bacterium]|nr:hypothetical protein [Campylobacterales bacterium]
MADIHSIFKTKFSSYASTLEATSYDNEKNEHLCKDTTSKVYDFDKIVKDKHPQKQPSSYDALLFQNNKVFCIEFKNQKYSDIDRSEIKKKLTNGKDVLDTILEENNIPKKDYKFVFCVAYNTRADRCKRGIAKNEIQFELSSYVPKYFDEVYTNDVEFFKNQYKKVLKKELVC